MGNKKVVWATDIHLNFLSDQRLEKFISLIQSKSPDILLVGGDIGEALNVASYLKRLEQSLDAKIYFVLGNHDFYNGSISEVRREIHAISGASDKLYYLDEISYVELSEDTALIGHSGWADGRFGDYAGSRVMLNDYVLIKEFIGLNKAQRLKKLNDLGDEAASQLQESIQMAIKHYKNILCLTHVPPFRESCWHEGDISDNNYLPHFACQAVGAVLKSAMQRNPDSHLKVLCGHTHSSGKAQILSNLEVITGGAIYGQPKIQEVIYL